MSRTLIRHLSKCPQGKEAEFVVGIICNDAEMNKPIPTHELELITERIPNLVNGNANDSITPEQLIALVDNYLDALDETMSSSALLMPHLSLAQTSEHDSGQGTFRELIESGGATVGNVLVTLSDPLSRHLAACAFGINPSSMQDLNAIMHNAIAQGFDGVKSVMGQYTTCGDNPLGSISKLSIATSIPYIDISSRPVWTLDNVIDDVISFGAETVGPGDYKSDFDASVNFQVKQDDGQFQGTESKLILGQEGALTQSIGDRVIEYNISLAQDDVRKMEHILIGRILKQAWNRPMIDISLD